MEDYMDEETSIFYKSDASFIDTGENYNVTRECDTHNSRRLFNGRPVNSLRSFPQGIKNCYTLKPEQGKNSNYLIRAFFQYGNYDNNNQVPKFDLYIGVNYWTTVELKDACDVGFPEIIHVPISDTITICLINTKSGIPFISALELRPLDKSIYQAGYGEALNRIARHDLGNTTGKQVRISGDVFDRLWYTITSTFFEKNWVPINTSSIIDTQGTNDSYQLPAQVLRTAIQPSSATFEAIVYDRNSTYSSKFYVCFHFAEIKQLKEGEIREFVIAVNEGDYMSENIILEYLKPLSICPNQTFEGHFRFSIKATQKSNLPPILNAFEIYEVLLIGDIPTDPRDVTAIMDIKQTLRIYRDDWTGDPCVPRRYLWSGLSCSVDETPRIISLDLSNNKLSGPIPDSLAQLSNLEFFSLGGNKLEGPIPEALLLKYRDGTLVLSLGENSDLCQSLPCQKKKNKALVIQLVAASAIAVVLLIFFALAIYKRKRRERVTESNINLRNRQYSYSEVVRATDNFKNAIGEGGFGKVYLGIMRDETQVAIKLLSQSSKQGYKEFKAEAEILTRVHHRNLVSLIGYCDEGENKALIYEYMANGNLRQHLSVTNANVLKWNERLQIAVDAANGLEYLHNGCKPPIIHRDFKSTNILLNENMQAKIADFGLSRAFVAENDTHVSTRPAGTLGYLDPKFQATGNLNRKSDIYSFGIVLFELITGHPAIIRGPEEYTHILDWVYPIIEQGDIQKIVDPRLKGEFHTNSAWKATEIALSCVERASIQISDMSEVSVELKECLALEMTHARSQRMATEGNKTISSNSVSSELQSDIVALAR
ncbi:hypothetical protein RGQ29_024989 [Quercus rubra]|uniref:non-specific serine/threonine protein kinase n=1 Tax=Quercus rubra TaxID=3512 RepID=A0AAN7EWW7_QUERU|nr:hypothetical protein RGQ29_024989 [Quercus rubra]